MCTASQAKDAFLGTNLLTTLDPLGLLKAPSVPAVPPVPASQSTQMPDQALLRKRRSASNAGGSLLTGPAGVTTGALTGSPSLLGG